MSLPSDVVIVTLPETLLATAVVALKPVEPLILATISSTDTALTLAPVNVTGISEPSFIAMLIETLPACPLKFWPSATALELATDNVAEPLCLFSVIVAPTAVAESISESAHKSPTLGEVYVFAYTVLELFSNTILSTEKDELDVEYSLTTIFELIIVL